MHWNFLSILTPYRGTVAYNAMRDSGRIREEKGWEFYNGYNVSFEPKGMSSDELLAAHRHLWQEAFSLRFSLARILRSARYLRLGAFLMCAFMNGFYAIKAFRRNQPMSFEVNTPYEAINHSYLEKMHAADQHT